MSRGFEDLVEEDKIDDVKKYVDQVDVVGKPVYQWVLVGFWAGNLDV